jgi:hypothetical protein
MRTILAILLWLLAAPAMAATVTLKPSGAACPFVSGAVDSGGNLTFNCIVHAPAPPGPLPPNPTPPPQPPPGCNPSAIQPPIGWGNVLQARQPSGAVYAYPLQAPEGGRASIAFTQGQQASTPPDAVTEYTVSNCPGVLDSGAGACYYRSAFTNNNGMAIYSRDIGIPGVCLATGPGPYYINVRWTYPSCPFGSCGFSLQWAYGPW